MISWLNRQLSKNIPEDIIAFNFNLYEAPQSNQFDVQLVGCKEYNADNDDWACNVQFSSGEDLFSFTADDWMVALEHFVDMIKKYLEQCDSSNRLKQAHYITAGFVDGDLLVVSSNTGSTQS